MCPPAPPATEYNSCHCELVGFSARENVQVGTALTVLSAIWLGVCSRTCFITSGEVIRPFQLYLRKTASIGEGEREREREREQGRWLIFTFSICQPHQRSLSLFLSQIISEVMAWRWGGYVCVVSWAVCAGEDKKFAIFILWIQLFSS